MNFTVLTLVELCRQKKRTEAGAGRGMDARSEEEEKDGNGTCVGRKPEREEMDGSFIFSFHIWKMLTPQMLWGCFIFIF